MKASIQSNGAFIATTLICIAFYVIFRDDGHFDINLSPKLNYFRDLAHSFLQGRLDVPERKGWADLVEYNGHTYLYWPPVPAIVYMPLVALFGKELPDVLISSIFAAVSVWLVMKNTQLLSLRFSLGLSTSNIVWVGLFWGLGTVQFYMARAGSVWYISQIMAQTFLLASLYFFLKKSETYISLILSGLFFALAVYTRNHLVFAFFFFMAIFYAKHSGMSLRNYFVKGLCFLTPFFVFSILNAIYNYTRFGDLFENGISFHTMDPYFHENFKQFGYFSTHYIKYNFYVEVIKFPALISQYPFIEADPEGFGFMWGSPLYWLVVPAFVVLIWRYATGRAISRHSVLIRTSSLLVTILVALVIFSIMGTGWAQFCARYTIDFQFFIVVFLLFSWGELKEAVPLLGIITLLLILCSFFIQYIGVLTF